MHLTIVMHGYCQQNVSIGFCSHTPECQKNMHAKREPIYCPEQHRRDSFLMTSHTPVFPGPFPCLVKQPDRLQA